MKAIHAINGSIASLLFVFAPMAHAQVQEAPPEVPAPASAGALAAVPIAGEYEEPPILKASEILRPEFAQGPGFAVGEMVTTYAGRNHFRIESDAGAFDADGNTQLMLRIAEIRAIRQLRETSRTEEYKSALKKAAKSPVHMAENLARDPVKTISGVPKGVWKFLNRTGTAIKEATQERERSPYEDTGVESLIGFSKVKRGLAIDPGVDPYSSNEVFQQELNGIAWASYGGSMTIRAAMAPVGGGAGAAFSAFSVTQSALESLKDLSPNDLRRQNLGKLLEMEVPREDAEEFLNNPAFSPTHQTAIVTSLGELRGAKWRSEYIYLCKQAADESDAIFYQRSAKLMANLHAATPLSRIGSLRGLPVALSSDGTLIVPIEWDYVSWTKPAADFAHTLQTIPWGNQKITSRRVVLTGLASPKARAQLAALGIQVTEKALPGPLL